MCKSNTRFAKSASPPRYSANIARHDWDGRPMNARTRSSGISMPISSAVAAHAFWPTRSESTSVPSISKSIA